MARITAQSTNITITHVNGEAYVAITGLARHKSDGPMAVIGNWMLNRNTVEFEADVLNVAMFGMTAKQWRESNPDSKGRSNQWTH